MPCFNTSGLIAMPLFPFHFQLNYLFKAQYFFTYLIHFPDFCRSVTTRLCSITLNFGCRRQYFNSFFGKQLKNPADFGYFDDIYHIITRSIPNVRLRIVSILERLNRETLFHHILGFGPTVLRLIFMRKKIKIELFGHFEDFCEFKIFYFGISIFNFVQP